ncbi:CLVS2-like protein [Mya arenaria]|uniref:CLVS2-like protein n=1 Tax=Mya arenaria TaxID=6604 RepID=A0ABY7F5P1_MYAAR|nr:CLVS2-like protein [Mya arenaria]
MAEYGWGLTPELVSKATTELNERQELVADAVEAVRDQMETRPDITFLRTDDAFILRFLRARKFDTFEAFKLFGRYFEYRQNHPNIFKDFNTAEHSVKEALFDGIPAVLEKPDHFGRRIIVLYSANWDNTRYGLAAIYRAILLTLEKLIDNEECQINGFVIIVDWSQFTFRQSTWLNPKILRQMIEGLQDCFPARFSAVHFVNQPWYIEAVFKMIRFHGINLGTLHTEIHKEVLPAELGGSEPPYNNQSRSKSFPADFYSPEKPVEDTLAGGDNKPDRGTYLDEEFFLID